MKNTVIQYWKEEEAAEAIQVILVAIMAIGIVTAVGFFLWSFFQRQSDNLTQVESHMDTPTDDPFGDGTNPFR